jgi:very-short-patch-repair endonuclease
MVTSERIAFARSLRRQPTAKLAVEIDGKQHEWFAEYDRGRTEVLERLGVQVLRFDNDEVCGDLDAVLGRIRAALRAPFV